MKKLHTISVVGLVFVLALLLASCGQTAAPSTYQVPQEMKDGWLTASPDEVGLDPEKIEALLRDIQGNGYSGLHGILLVQDGKLVLEEYARGQGNRSMHSVASVTKSITSALIGIAIEQGAIASTDQTLAELLPEYVDLIAADPAKRDVTLWHILTMTSGFEWDEETYPYGTPQNDCERMKYNSDPIRFVLERPIVREPGTQFEYSCANSMLLSAILTEKTGQRADKFAKEHLFKPLGIHRYRWGLYANGLSDTDGGLSLRARDMAKIGQLYLNGGEWQGQQVIPQSWIEESTQAYVPAIAGADYGYQWWRTGVPVGLRSADTYFASGFGGQQINVFPELDLVVVFTNAMTDGSGHAMRNLALMSEYILPAALPVDTFVVLPWLWPALVILSLLTLLWDLARSKAAPLGMGLYWAWIVIIFGPLGFLVYLVSYRRPQNSKATWRRALGATLFSASGNTAGFILLFAILVLLQPQFDALLLALFIPLLVGWLIFRAPMFAHQAGQGYGRALRRTLLAEFITTILVLAGMLPVIILLQFRWFPLGNFNLADPLFWMMISLAAMAGAVFSYPFNYWMARRRLGVWPGRSVTDGQIPEDSPSAQMPSLRNA